MKQVIRASGFIISVLLVIALLSPPDTSAASQESRRVALIIGNNSYPTMPLRNAVNDAHDMRNVLREIGFDVRIAENTNLRDMELAIRSFTGLLRPGDVALFFYSGHAFQAGGENYLIPIDFDARNEVDAKYDSFSAERIRELMEQAGTRLNIIVMDACRDNPFSVSRSGARGLAAMQYGRGGTFIAFATGPGQTASDNPSERNGLFTRHLKDTIQIPGLTLDQVFNRVREEVFQASNGNQVPWSTSSVIGDFYFIQTEGGAVTEEPGEPVEIPEPEVQREAIVGILVVNVNVAGAQVLVDIATSSGPERLTLSNIPIGFHRVTVRRDGYRSNVVNRQVALRRGQTEELDAWLESEAAETVSTEPTAEGGIWRDRAGLDYVYIPPGSFQMGAVPGDDEAEDDESPRHRVTITRGFRMSRTEVTVRAYKRFCDATGRSMPSAPDFNPNWRNLDHPIVNVTWHDAVAYCEWAGVRLPTEAEWEYAARGGQDGQMYVWGNQRLPVVNGINQANVADEAAKRQYSSWTIFGGYNDGYVHTAPVGSFAANGFGLYDMAGNVWEWCSDWYNSGYYGAPASRRDPRGPSSGERRVLRGGSWNLNPRYLRVSNRLRLTPGDRNNINGFRCIRDLGSLNP